MQFVLAIEFRSIVQSLAVRSHIILSEIAHDPFQPAVSVYPAQRVAAGPLLRDEPSPAGSAKVMGYARWINLDPDPPPPQHH
jgi:hypothetical protein